MAERSGGVRLLLVILLINTIYSQVPTKRLCGDVECKGAISIALIKKAYKAQSEQEVDLEPGIQIAITSKNVQGDGFWGGVVNGKHGYFPYSHVEELKVLNTNPNVVVPTKPLTDDFSDLAKAFDEMSQATKDANNIASKEEADLQEQPVADSTSIKKETTESPDEEEEEGEEEDEGEYYEDDDETGEDEEEEEGEEDVLEDTETQSNEEESETDPTEAGHQHSSNDVQEEKTEPEKTTVDETTTTNKQIPEETKSDESKSDGTMIGGMFGGKKEEDSPLPATGDAPEDQNNNSKDEKQASETKVQEDALPPETEEGTHDPTEAFETETEAEEEEDEETVEEAEDDETVTEEEEGSPESEVDDGENNPTLDDSSVDDEALPDEEISKDIQPTPTDVVEEVEHTVTGTDGLRSVVFDGTTLPLDEKPLVNPTVVPEATPSILSSPSLAEQTSTFTPPLEVSLEASHTSIKQTPSDLPSPSSPEMVHHSTEQSEEVISHDGLFGHQADADASGGQENNTGPMPPGDSHIPTPALENGREDPYSPGEFMSRRFLQSEVMDTPEMQENMKNEQIEEVAQDSGYEVDKEQEPEESFHYEQRTEPDGQEEPPVIDEPETVTPSTAEIEEPLPPVGEEDVVSPTPPTLPEEEEQTKKEEGTGVVGNFVGALDAAFKFLDPLVAGFLSLLPPSVGEFLDHEPFGFPAPRAALISAFAFSFITLGVASYCIALCSGKKRDPLAKVSALEDKLFINSKERDELQQTVEKLSVEIEETRKRLDKSEGGGGELERKLQTVKLHTSALQRTSTEQEAKIEELTSQNTEYAEVVAAKDAQLEQLVYQVNQYTEQLNTTNLQLQESWQAQVVAQTQTAELQVQVEQLTEEVSILVQSKDQLQLQIEGWNEKVGELTEEISVMTEQQKENEKLLAFKDSEMDVMRDCFVQLKALQADTTGGTEEGEQEHVENEEDHEDGVSAKIQTKITAMMDVSKINASLNEVTEERDILKQKLEIEVDARKDLEDDIQKMQVEMDKLKEGHRQAEAQSQEATTKLNVLSSYFKEKEVELTASLGEQLVKSKESQDQLVNVDEKAKQTEEEMASYRAQVDDLKKEIENVERDFRTQVAANEKKAHENWLAARQAERDLKEAKNEAAMLRQKLLDLERKQELVGPVGLIRPLPTRGIPPPGMNGPPPPGMMPIGPPPLGPSPHAMGDRPISRGSAIPHSPHTRDDHDYMPPPPPMRGRPPMMDRPPPPPGGRISPPGKWGPGGRGRSPPSFDRRSPPPFDRRSPPPFDRRSPPSFDRHSPPPFDRRSPPPPFDRRGPPPDRRSPPPHMFRGPPPPDRRGPPPPGYRSPEGGYRRTPPHGRPYPPDQPPPGDYRKGLDPRASDTRGVDPRTSSPYDRPSSSASRNPDQLSHRSQSII